MPNLLSTRAFSITVDADPPVIVTPINSGLKYRWQLEEKTRFYRKKLTTKLLFRGADYTLLKGVYDAGTCSTVTILIELYCGGTWREEYTGKIVVGQCEWNLDRCEVTVDVLPYDVYDCFKRILKKNINWLSLASGVTLKTMYGTIEETECTYSSTSFGTPQSEVLFLKDCWSGGSNDTTESTDPDPSLAWRPILHTQLYDPGGSPELDITTTWGRETVNSVTPPPGDGWIFISGTKYVRPLLYSTVYRSGFLDYSTTGTRYDFITETFETDISGGRLFSDLFENITDVLGCADVTEVQSDFFGINAPASAPSNDAYDFATDHMQNVLMFQKSDIVRHAASTDATVLNMSLDDFLTSIRDAVNLYWSLEPIGGGEYALRIEHWTYFEAANGLDITALDGGIYTTGNNKFKADSEIPNAEIFAYQEAYNEEFTKKRIEYPQDCTDGENEEDYSLGLLSCDVGGLVDNTDAGLTGFVLVSTADLGGGEYLISNLNDVLNGAFAWKALHENVWPFGRFYTEATSGASASFAVQTVRRMKEQDRFAFKYCCEETDFDPVQLLKSGIGWGQIKDIEHDTEKDIMNVSLLHT